MEKVITLNFWKIAVIVLSIIIVFMLLFKSDNHTYTVISPSDYDLEDTLNSYGDKGCTIASARRALSDNIPSYEIILECP